MLIIMKHADKINPIFVKHPKIIKSLQFLHKILQLSATDLEHFQWNSNDQYPYKYFYKKAANVFQHLNQ